MFFDFAHLVENDFSRSCESTEISRSHAFLLVPLPPLPSDIEALDSQLVRVNPLGVESRKGCTFLFADLLPDWASFVSR